jgi:hypothetical protein
MRCPDCNGSGWDEHPTDVWKSTPCIPCRGTGVLDDHSASRRVDVLEREAPHLLADPVIPMAAPLEADGV